MTGVTLRAARAADAPAITDVFLAARRPMTYLPVLHTDDEAARFIAAVVAADRVQVAERDGAVVGFAAVHGSWLAHLYVHPSSQNAGLGSSLIGWAKEIAPAGLDLWVFQRNTGARALYASHGWRDLVLTDGADNEEGQPDVHMRWEPSP
ncbi:MAG TPA: GNAT family N-acetyltransferase [Acidimicrobiales bacterium]|nr:GNAT family N-acetyltransferase [Acidimicrobiales bacterium]